MASSSASLQDGAGPGLAGMMMARAAIAPSTSTYT